MSTIIHGPFTVVKNTERTRVQVQAGDRIGILASGLVDFGGAVLGAGAPILDANGDDWATPPNYPAPALRKNSLICRVGETWYRGGEHLVQPK